MGERVFEHPEFGDHATLKYCPDLGELYDGKCWWVSFSNTEVKCYKTERGALNAIKKRGYVQQSKI